MCFDRNKDVKFLECDYLSCVTVCETHFNDFDIQIPIKILSQTKRDPIFFLTELKKKAWFLILS